MSKTYKVVRIFARQAMKVILRTGLTLEEAQTHCRDPETNSHTAVMPDAVERTEKFGPWADHYYREEPCDIVIVDETHEWRQRAEQVAAVVAG